MNRKTATIHDPATVPEPSFAHVTTAELNALGVSISTIKRKLSSGEWEADDAAHAGGRKRQRLVLISSLPVELQLKWARQNFLPENLAEPASSSDESPEVVHTGVEKRLNGALLRIPPDERVFWIKEALRLSHLLVRYGEISPKREQDPATGEYEFVPGVLELCQEAACNEPAILAREPHRSQPPSPYTLDRWWRKYQSSGLLTFFRESNNDRRGKSDKRLAVVLPAAVVWMNENWSKCYGPRPFYDDLQREAATRGWEIPSESWVYRQWQKIPEIVRTYYLEGQKAYESKYAPYVPRDVSDLQALQILAGDHSERDVMVSLLDGTIRRPWLTTWYDLRTGLIWGWHLSLIQVAS